MVNIQSIKELSDELSAVIRDNADHHNNMRMSRDYYKYSAFYESKSGDSKNKAFLKANLLKVFAKKNIQYTTDLPTFKVPVSQGDPEERKAASIREKIIYGVHTLSGSKMLQKKYATDATLFSEAINVTRFDFKRRKAVIERYDPRYCYYKLSNDNDRRVIAFWAVFPITRTEAKQKYGVEPTTSYFDTRTLALDRGLKRLDDEDRFMLALRIDENTRVAWIGDQFAEKPHNHQMGFMPVDVCIPFEDGDTAQHGAFYLEDLVPLQAELNETIRQRGSIVRRMGNPIIYGNGIMNRQFDDLEKKLKGKSGGLVGLRAQGSLGLLQVPDTNMLDNHKNDLIVDMMRIAGFNAAAFGEMMGANTSGDALGMYFTPTTRHINDQMVSWISFWESINSKILRLYDRFGLPDEKFSLSGYIPAGTLMGVTEGDGDQTTISRSAGGFQEVFTKAVINGKYTNIALPPSVTPKDDIVSKRFYMDAANSGFMSRTTAYEEIGILSPEDELSMLTSEQSNPVLNPDGFQKIAQAVATTQAAGQTGEPQKAQIPAKV